MHPAVSIACALAGLAWLSCASRPVDLLGGVPPLLLWGGLAENGERLRRVPAALWRLRYLFLAQLALGLWVLEQDGGGGAESSALFAGSARLALLIIAARVMLPVDARTLLAGLNFWCGPLDRLGLPGRRLALRLGLTLHYCAPGRPAVPAGALPADRAEGLRRALQSLARRLEEAECRPPSAIVPGPGTGRPRPLEWLFPLALLYYYVGWEAVCGGTRGVAACLPSWPAPW